MIFLRAFYFVDYDYRLVFLFGFGDGVYCLNGGFLFLGDWDTLRSGSFFYFEFGSVLMVYPLFVSLRFLFPELV